MPFIDVGDLSIYHEFHGEGPPLLHISGSGGDLRATAPNLHGLNATFLGLHYDQRGLGRTSLGDREPTMADFADDAAALCGAAGWERCRVVGTSFGGMVAQHLAVRHPDLVERMVLNCTSPGGDAPSYPIHELQADAPGDRSDTWLTLLDTRYDANEGGEIPGLGGYTKILRENNAQSRTGGAATGYTRQLEARRTHDVNDQLGSIVAPTLVCAGRYDGIAPVANSERIVAGIPDAELALFDGGHIFMLQDPTSLDAARDFLAG